MLLSDLMTGAGINIPEIAMPSMAIDNFYIMEMDMIDEDTLEATKFTDIVWMFIDSVPGQGVKKVKQISGTKLLGAKKFGMLPGAKFYGPIGVKNDQLLSSDS